MRRYYFVSCLLAAGVGFAAVANVVRADESHSHRYAVHNLVSDGGVTADHTDPALINPWGIAFNPTAVVWVANNGTATSTLYDGTGAKIPLTVAIPPGTRGPANPTGIVYSGSADFVVTQAGKSGPSRFIFSGEGGTISGWSPAVNATNSVTTYDAVDGAVYKGLAIGSNGTGNFIYAADFHNGKVDVFNRTFTKVAMIGDFRDPYIPTGYAPFGIQNVLGNIYVLYAKQDGDAHDEIPGRGLGFVSVFDTNGQFIRRLASRQPLNAPWGIALAPADFGRFSNRLLVGNFGDGTIDAYDLASGAFVGQLQDANGRTLKIDGLWGLSFGNGVQGQATNSLFFTAGANDEANGVYGSIDPIAGEDRDNDRDGDKDSH